MGQEFTLTLRFGSDEPTIAEKGDPPKKTEICTKAHEQIDQTFVDMER